MRLLHVIASVDPANGGPIECVRVSGQEMQRRGHVVEVVSLDEPGAGDALGLPVHSLGPSLGRYGWNRALGTWLASRAPHVDATVVHGLWQYPGIATRRALHPLGRPYFVFAHGMLDPWFRRAYPLKDYKKRAYWRWAESRVLRDAQAVLFTCEEERRLAQASFQPYRAREAVVAFGTAEPPADAAAQRAAFFAQLPHLAGRRLLTFLGRLHPKKGIDLLVEAFARLANAAPGVSLVIAGPDPDGIGDALRRSTAAAGLADRVVWTGMLRGDVKWGALRASEAFVLPSHQENFGIAVVEALGCGVPVLVSDKVNIWREIVDDGAGLVAPDTTAGTAALLRRWLSLDADERLRMSRAARRCFAQRFTVTAMADSLERVLTPST
jgi:glycosyltransferase involved in cell wall biosynthesis